MQVFVLKTCVYYLLFSWKTALANIVMVGILIHLFRGNLSSELNLIFIYFLLQSSEFLVFDLIFSLLWLVGNSVKYLFPLISSKYPFTLLKIKHRRFYIFPIFYRHVSNVVIRMFLYDFSSILILFGSKLFTLIISLKK